MLLLAACSSPPPAPPPAVTKTSAMGATVTVVGDGQATLAEIALLGGAMGTDHLDLGSGDSLTASKGTPQPMTKQGMGATLRFDASFGGMDADGTVYTIAFTRTADVGAPGTTATMPMPLSIQMPAAGASFSRVTDDIPVTYSPSGGADPISWSIEGPCVRATGMQPVTGDSGNFTIGRGGLHEAGGGGACDATLAVYRTRPGKLDPAFGRGGSVTAQQLAKVTISTKP